MRRIAHVLIVASTMAGLTSLVVPQASAATAGSVSLSSHIQKVKTSSGKRLSFSLTAYKSTTRGDTSKVQLSVNLSTGSPYSKGETHGWRFATSRSSFTYGSGKGSVVTGKQLGKFGSLTLHYAKASQSTAKCSVSGSTTTVHGTLRGSINFNSNSASWGKVHKSSYSFATPNFITVSNGCNNGEGQAQCYTGTTWSGPPIIGGATSTFESGFATAGSSTITGSRNVSLSAPAGASRTDILTGGAPAPKVSGNNLAITTSSGTGITGSAKISGGSAQNGPASSCTINGHKKTQHTASHYNGSGWSSSGASRLTFHFQVGGSLATPTSGSAGWSRNTYS